MSMVTLFVAVSGRLFVQKAEIAAYCAQLATDSSGYVCVSKRNTLDGGGKGEYVSMIPCNRFFFCFSGMHHYEYVAPYVDISLHRGQFWSRSTASFSVRL